MSQDSRASKATHFLSWSWSYNVSTMTSGLSRWSRERGIDVDRIFVWICFFVNNQYRILVEGENTGTRDLSATFATRLQGCGRVLVLLDTFKDPIYMKRVWCVFETYHATRLSVPLELCLPEKAYELLRQDLRSGRIEDIRRGLADVHIENATAWRSRP